MFRRPSARALLGIAAALALSWVLTGSAPARGAQAPELLEPADGQTFTTGELGVEIVFRIRYVSTHPGEKVYLNVSRSTAVRSSSCGYISSDLGRGEFRATSDPSVWEARTTIDRYFTGTAYWQADSWICDPALSSAVRPLRIVAPARPLSEARLLGKFKLTLRVTSATKSAPWRAGERHSASWELASLCADGPCGARLLFGQLISSGGIYKPELRLVRTGPSYAGRGKATLYQCAVTAVSGTADVRLHVTAAAWYLGGWRATKIAGTFRHSLPATTSVLRRCPASSFAASFTGVVR